MKKILASILFTAMVSLNLSGLAMANDFNVLPANTPVNIQLNNTHHSATVKAGDTVTFTVLNNVTVNGKAVIPAGATVVAEVTKAAPRGKVGRPGEITVNNFYTTLANGTRVPLTGEILEKAKSKMGLSITLSALIIPFFLFMKGKDVEMTQGSQYTVYTVHSTNF